MNDDGLKYILYQNITNEGVSIDFLYEIMERENKKRATGEKKLRDLSAEGKLDTQRKRRTDGYVYWEVIHQTKCNDTVIGYRRKIVEVKEPKFKMAFKPARLFALRPQNY